MPGVLFTPAQVATLLDALALEPGAGSPLHAVAPALPLVDGQAEHRALRDAAVLVASADGARANAAVAAALRACALPDEVLWFGAGTAGASVTVCRRGRLFVDCSSRPDGRVLLTFPLDRAQLVLLAIAALSGDRPEPKPSGFALHGPITDLFLLRAIADLEGRSPQHRPFGPGAIAEAVAALLDDPTQRVAVGAYGGLADLEHLTRVDAGLDEALTRLTEAGHLICWEPTEAAPAGFRLTATTAAIIDAPVTASFGVGRRSIAVEPDGGRHLREARLRVERRGDRLIALDVREVDGAADVQLIERTRAEIRSLVGVFLLGDIWDRVAGRSAAVTSS